MRIARMSPRLSVTRWLSSGRVPGQVGRWSGSLHEGAFGRRHGDAQPDEGGRRLGGAGGRWSARPLADAVDGSPQLGRDRAGKLLEAVPDDPGAVPVAGPRGRG